MKTKYIVIILFFLGVVTRLPFIEQMQSHWDGPQYSIAVVSYDLGQETPSPPGYPIYIFLGKVLNVFFNDPHFSLLVLGVIFSGLTACTFFLAGEKIFSKDIGIIASLIYLSSPVFYFFGLTAYAYGMVPFFVILIATTVHTVYIEKKNTGALLGLSFGIFLGVRPQDGLNMLPLVLLGFIYLSGNEKLRSITAFMAAVLLWFTPLLILTGGLTDYFMEIGSFLKRGALSSVIDTGPLENLRRIGKGSFLTLGVGLSALLYFPFRITRVFSNAVNYRLSLFFALWILPGLLSTIFIRNDHAGYQMIYLTALVLLTGYALDRVFSKVRYPYLIVAFIVLFNLFWFFHDRDPGLSMPYVPTSFHFSEIRKNDLILNEKFTFIRERFSPQDTLILVADSDYFRPVMYHLPEYAVIAISTLDTQDPRYMREVRRGLRWQKREYKSGGDIFALNANTKRIVLFDESDDFILPQERVIHTLSHGFTLTEIPVSEGDMYRMEFKKIERIHD